jgi:hypothetical protein
MIPSDIVRHNNVTVRAIVPSNRTMYRRAHTRYEYRVNNRRVTRADAITALNA